VLKFFRLVSTRSKQAKAMGVSKTSRTNSIFLLQNDAGTSRYSMSEISLLGVIRAMGPIILPPKSRHTRRPLDLLVTQIATWHRNLCPLHLARTKTT
jgi:hypothetical protein